MLRTLNAKQTVRCLSSETLNRYLGPTVSRFCHYSTIVQKNDTILQKSDEKPIINEVGIQYLSKSLHDQLFASKEMIDYPDDNKWNLTKAKNEKLLKLAKMALSNNELLGKKTCISEPISFKLPKLQGDSLDEHFQKLGHFASEPYKTMALQKFTKIPELPKTWLRKPGWTRYVVGKEPEFVPYPLEQTLVFDVETLYKISHYPTLATAVSEKAWYSWCSPYICPSGDDDSTKDFKHLIPLDTLSKERLIIGHNVSYDRARVLEEYNFGETKSFYLDTQSLHIATSGLCSRQRYLYKRNHKKKEMLKSEQDEDLKRSIANDVEDDPWLAVSALNSLKDVAKYHCNIDMDKSVRDFFAETDKQIIIDNFQMLMSYCANDVAVTSKVFDQVFPAFLKKCPHPVSFAALKPIGNSILPVRYNKWNNYVEKCENVYQMSMNEIEQKIIDVIEDLVKLREKPEDELIEHVSKDPWLRQLDWTIKPVRITKQGKPYKNQKLPRYPEWYRSLFPNAKSTKPDISLNKRQIPIFFKLSWENYPVVWTDFSGWCFAVPQDLVNGFKKRSYVLADSDERESYKIENKTDDVLIKIPHPNSPDERCTRLFSKSYVHHFEKGIITSRSEFAKDAIKLNASLTYWKSTRDRVKEQFVVSKQQFKGQFKFNEVNCKNDANGPDDSDLAIILPQIVAMGTVTRRAVEKTWLTASNAKKNRLGSELKTQVSAPEGYCFVGADVDSEELWIASLVGDSVFKIHGGTPIGWMCLEGTKNEGTDLHTKTANVLGISRNDAKIFNYGRIYGAGVKFAGQLLKQFNPTMTEEEAKKTAVKLYEHTKGKSKHSKMFQKFWYGGSESVVFNRLENIANQDIPRTPVLGCSITNALMKSNLSSNSFLPSRINWTIQSSGVDYLHLLCCSMEYLIKKYKLNARFCISIHDEIRYLASKEDAYKVAMALQVSNIWTRSMFCEQMGIDNLPQNCAFFSAVDIDHVLRKEVDMDCITPTNKVAIPHGESLDIRKLLAEPSSVLQNEDTTLDISNLPYQPRTPTFEEYNKLYSDAFLDYFLTMQVQTNKANIISLEKDYLQRVREQELAQDGEVPEYSLRDYIYDVQEGKQKKLDIISFSMLPEQIQLNEQHSILRADNEPKLVKGRKKTKTQVTDKKSAKKLSNPEPTTADVAKPYINAPAVEQEVSGGC